MSATLTTLARFPLPNYLIGVGVAARAHRAASQAVSGWNNPPNEAGELKMLADVIYAQAVRAGKAGKQDYSRSVIVASLLDAFVELLNYERGGWDGGTCDAWARSVAEWIGQPMG